MTKRVEHQAVREVHEIRDRMYEEQKAWTTEQRLEYYNRVGADLAKQLGLRVAEPKKRQRARKLA